MATPNTIQKGNSLLSPVPGAKRAGNEGGLLPRALRPSFAIATFLVCLELVIASIMQLPIAPFLVCAGGFAVVIAWAVREQARWGSGRVQVARRVLLMALLLKVMAVWVAVTGGFASPIKEVLFLPVFLGALYYGIRGSLLSAIAVHLFFGGLWLLGPGGPASLAQVAVQSAVLFVVAVFAGLFARQLSDTAAIALVRAREQEQRVAEVEWFTDTSVMMQSLYDIEHMLSVALLRLGLMVPCDAAAVYLCESNDAPMLLAQTLGLRDADVGLRCILPAEFARLRDLETGVLCWADTATASDIGDFRLVDPLARAVMVVPLRTLDAMFGAIVVTVRGTQVFGERERSLLSRYAQHIVYPIRRVRIEAMATTDALTGLANRRAFLLRLQEEVERARRYASSLSLVLLDIDHFKRVNDTLGHPAGDAILEQMGEILRQSLRVTDFPARYGGEELVVICPETSPDAAQKLAERVRARVEGTQFHLPDGGTFQIKVSAGVASLPDHAFNDDALLKQADEALYKAKRAGRNQVRVAVSATASVP